MSKVVVGIISRKNPENVDEYLLVSAKTDFGKYTGYYYPPGGHVEEGEEVADALKREIQEELQFEIESVREIAAFAGDIEGQMTYWWECKAEDDMIIVDENEIVDARFFTKEEMNKLHLWPATKKFFDEYIFKVE